MDYHRVPLSLSTLGISEEFQSWLPYSRKYWRSLNLAVWYGIAIRRVGLGQLRNDGVISATNEEH